MIYFVMVFGALPAFAGLEAWTAIRFPGWTRIILLLPGLYVGWAVFNEAWPVVLHWQELDPSDLRRLLYERWSAVSRVSLDASAVWLALLGLCGIRHWRRKPGAS